MEERTGDGRAWIEGLLQKCGQRYAHVRFEKWVYSRSKCEYALFLRVEKSMTPGGVLSLKRFMQRELADFPGKLEIVVVQPGGALAGDDARLFDEIRSYVMSSARALTPFILEAKMERDADAVDITFNREAAPRIFEGLGIARKIEEHLRREFGIDIRIRALQYADFVCPDAAARKERREPQEEGLPEPPAEPAAIPMPEPAPVRRSAPAPSAPRPQRRSGGGKNLMQSSIHGPSTPLSALEQEEECVIEGEVFAVQMRLVKDGRFTIIELAVTDYTTSVQCKAFLRGDRSEDAAAIREGGVYKLRGTLKYDNFSRGDVFDISAMCPGEKQEIHDLSEEKRVELHLHTAMSLQDAMTPAADYIAQAAKWGHKAIAITDHGVVQAFPEAAGAGKKHGVKIIFGMEAYMVDDETAYSGARDHAFTDEFVVFDIETTGLSPRTCAITEIGAVRIREGKVMDEFATFVNPGGPIPYNIVRLTGITDDMVKDAPGQAEAIAAFREFIGDACAVAHNAAFDTSFVFKNKYGICFENDVLDSIAVARVVHPDMRSYKLNKLADHYKLKFNHHRAVNDARVTAEILLRMFQEAGKQGCTSVAGLNGLVDTAKMSRSARPYHTILLCKNKTGLVNLYKLVSAAHLEFFYKRPRIPKSYIQKYREGLIVGSACEQGEVYRSVLNGDGEKKQREIASFYDYLEIQPNGNNMFLIREGTVADEEALCDINRRIYALGKELGKPTVATCDVHYLRETDGYFRAILQDSMGFKDCDIITPLEFKTTDRMLAEFAYLGEETAREVVITNPNAIADMTEEIELFPGETAMPKIESAAEDLESISYDRMKRLYGDPLPEIIERRLQRELGSIINNGFAVLYWIAMKLVQKSNADGYLVGSRGSVGSSLAAFASGISEVNPLPPHYRCPACQHSDFDVDREKYGCGVDMPPAKCPVCGAEYVADGYEIPFEVFLGIDADKVPDIDLNFSGDYQPTAHKYVVEIFGKDNVFRAGTISAIQEKTAAGYVLKYMEKRGKNPPKAEITRLARGCSGVKRTTGQHPGGLVIVPKDREVYEFTAVQRPADKVDGDTITTHFDFNSMHDILIKLDILGHDNPTIIRLLEDMTGIDPLAIPLNDEATMSLFCGTEALGIKPEDIRGIEVGTLGIPEFGTKFVRQMLLDTHPKTMSELVRISGLSHGTDVWLGNAKELIDSGITNLNGAICTRDDIMNYLVRKGVEQRTAFFIMEAVRKGQWAKGKDARQEEREAAMREAGVEEWFIESCRKIKYMFPKAHAVAYVVMAFRIAYCKVHYPREYYATFFTVKGGGCFDASTLFGDADAIIANMQEIEQKDGLSATDEDLLTMLELVVEMKRRGIDFLPVDLKKSRAKQFVVEEGGIRLPFVTIPKLGDKAAEALEAAVADGEFVSIEELKQQTKLSQTVIDSMKEMGCLAGLPDRAQLSLFDTFG